MTQGVVTTRFLCLVRLLDDPGYTSEEIVIRICTKATNGDWIIEGPTGRYYSGCEIIESIPLGRCVPRTWIEKTGGP